MSQADLLINVVKKVLKREGITYATLAPGLGLSEAGVKRMFSEGNFTIKRLNEICELVGIQFSELTRLMENEEKRTDQLSRSQEQQLASDTRLMLMAFLVINGLTIGEMIDNYRFTETEAVHYLAQLDKLNIIELLPNNRIKLIISSKFSWRRDGPIQKFFIQKLQKDFLSNPFSGEKNKHYFLTAMLSEKNARELERQIEVLVQECKIRNLDDYRTEKNEKQIYSILLAMRAWQPHAFDELRR